MTTIPCPTESVEQQNLFRWARLQSGAHPELALLYHIPNEGKRSVHTGRRMRAEGLKRGVPDVCLPVARGGRHGLYVGLKRLRGSKTNDDQHQRRPAGMAGGAGAARIRSGPLQGLGGRCGSHHQVHQRGGIDQ